MPGTTLVSAVLWFMSTCILNGVAFTVFPSFVAGYLGSKSANTIRRNAIFLPMYSLLLLVPVMLGMAALFVVPNLETNDLALLTMVTRLLAYITTSASVLVLRRRHGDPPGTLRLPGGPLIPMAALALSLALLLTARPAHLVAVGIAVLLGSVIYRFPRRGDAALQDR